MFLPTPRQTTNSKKSRKHYPAMMTRTAVLSISVPIATIIFSNLLAAVIRYEQHHFKTDLSGLEASIKDSTFPDSALGLPKAGESYAQMMVDGYKVLLKGDHVHKLYHLALLDPPEIRLNPDPTKY